MVFRTNSSGAPQSTQNNFGFEGFDNFQRDSSRPAVTFSNSGSQSTQYNISFDFEDKLPTYEEAMKTEPTAPPPEYEQNI